MPQFKSFSFSNRQNNQAVMQCSAYGKLSANVISKDDKQQNLFFKAIVYQGNNIVHSSSFFSLKFELPRLAIGHYRLEIIPKRDETFFWYKQVQLKDFSYNFEIKGDTTTVVECSVNRKESIIYNIKYQFFVLDRNNKTDEAPLIELGVFEEVTGNKESISNSSKKFNLDENLLKAVVYMESTHGYYDEPLNWVGVNKSIRPSNINVAYWPELVSRQEANDKQKNLDIGAYMLKLIELRIPKRSVREISSVYNDINAKSVTDYGMRVNRIYVEKPYE
ncbi:MULTISPECIES: hypothetical protein [Acinetobacter]|uniref:hypothetical protein n=1 Tax=Acinetobacter TaxID=469 RepID=UPI001F61D3A3|nr:hypothetical protein [Acinetobacter higginsii]MCI3880808.1 hypothetical protein [Acinetobacter higginsii]